MNRQTNTTLFGAAAFALAAMMPLASHAASANDGNWVFDFPAEGLNAASGEYQCPALRLTVNISDNKVSGNLERTPVGQGSGSLRSGSSSKGSPIAGTVKSDGGVHATWENYSLDGRLANGAGTVTTAAGQCGPRKGTAVRIAG